MKLIIRLVSITFLAIASMAALAAPHGSGTIKVMLELVRSYNVEATTLQFGEHILPKKGADTINIAPGSAGASVLTIEGDNGEATVSLENKGDFELSGAQNGQTLTADAFFEGNQKSTKVDLVDGKATVSVGGQTKVTASTPADDYTGDVTVDVVKNA